MPPNSLWNGIDLLLNYDASARQRAGWVDHTGDLSTLVASDYIRGGIFATFSTPGGGESSQNLAINEDGWVFNVTDENAPVSIGQAVQIAQNPFYHGATAAQSANPIYTGLVIIPDATAASVPKKYDGIAISDLNGNPPKAKYGCVFKDYTLLGNGSVGLTYYPSRTWFSPTGDPDLAASGAQTAWDTTDSWRDFFLPIKGYGTAGNACLVFHESAVSRIRGEIPPPGDDSDMIFEDGKFKIGLLDPFSITEYKDNVYWCAPEGVFRSDGVVQDDLTKRGSMLRPWLDLTDEADSTWTFSTGIERDNLFIFALDGSDFRDGFMVDLQTTAWTRLSNIDAASCWHGLFGVSDELYWGRRGTARVSRLGSIFDVGNPDLKNDGNGNPVQAIAELPFEDFTDPGLKRFRRGFFGYSRTDYAEDGPTVDVSYILTPQEVSYDAAGELTATETYARKALDVKRKGPGIAFRLECVGAGDFSLHDVGVEVSKLEGSRRV